MSKRITTRGQVADAVGPAEAPALGPQETPAIEARVAPEKVPRMTCPGCPQTFRTREQWVTHTRNHAHARVNRRAA